MSDNALALTTSYKTIEARYETKEAFYTENLVQEVEIVPDDATRDFPARVRGSAANPLG